MQDLVEDLRRRSEGIDRRDAIRRVTVEHGGCGSLIDFHAVAQDAFIGIIRTALLDGPSTKPLKHLFDIIADQVKYLDDRDLLIQQGSLPDCAGNAIQHE